MPDCDVAVIGAGVIGAAITYELVTRGASVTLVDSRGAGLGSTQAAAGMLVPYLEGFGRPILPLAARSLEMYDAFVDRISRDAGIGIGYCRTGSLQVVTADEPLDTLEQIAADARDAGIECEILDAQAAREAEPQLTPDVVCSAVCEASRLCRRRRSLRCACRRCDQARHARSRPGARSTHRKSRSASRGSTRKRRAHHGTPRCHCCGQLVWTD